MLGNFYFIHNAVHKKVQLLFLGWLTFSVTVYCIASMAYTGAMGIYLSVYANFSGVIKMSVPSAYD